MTDVMAKEPNTLDADELNYVISKDKHEKKGGIESKPKPKPDACQEMTEKERRDVQDEDSIDRNLKTCENPETILQDIEDWNMDCQQLIKENKRIKAGLNLLLDEREKLLSENATLNEGVEKFHVQIQDLHVHLSRLDELEAENKDLKNIEDKLQTDLENVRQEKLRKDQENVEKLNFLKECHKEELKNLTDQMTSTANYERKTLQEKISQNEKEILGLQMGKNQLQAQKESELADLTQEYETNLTNLHQQKLQQHQIQINQQNQEMFRKKLQHMKDEYEKEIKGLKRTIEDYQIGSRPSPRSRERLTLTTVGGKKRKT